MDEMSIKEATIDHMQSNAVHGLALHNSLWSSTLALIAGFLVRAIEDNIECEGCLVKLRATSSTSPSIALIAGVDMGGLYYPTLPFVGFAHHLEQAASRVASVLAK
ncbi:hypothetical protein HPB48_001617 [Haemaphysalis longicornis]|uniref:Uncharacterized protein n=1 Tax=Haemaphysalis longicornis TaxID=44386 RepID=A0A9J6FBB6_HAELO|nr:hypothetical protein HPB48_001617 [Haemaphysalis longicornis]